MIHYKYTESEITAILKTLTIVIDTREQVNDHILQYLRKHDIPFVNRAIKTGDYACMIPANEKFGIKRDIWLSSRIERKAHMDEITGNLQKDTKTAFENELIRAKDIPFTLLCEDADGYGKMIRGEYRSQYKPLSLLGMLNSFKYRYNFEIVYLDRKYSGNFIYYHFYYQAKDLLKNGVF